MNTRFSGNTYNLLLGDQNLNGDGCCLQQQLSVISGAYNSSCGFLGQVNLKLVVWGV